VAGSVAERSSNYQCLAKVGSNHRVTVSEGIYLVVEDRVSRVEEVTEPFVERHDIGQLVEFVVGGFEQVPLDAEPVGQS
jgi:hypothetical protein